MTVRTPAKFDMLRAPLQTPTTLERAPDKLPPLELDIARQPTTEALGKFAVFDIDGTLFRWQLYHALVHQLAMSKLLPRSEYDAVTKLKHAWEAGDCHFKDYEQSVVEILEQHLPEIDPKKYDRACRKVVADTGHKTYNYTRELAKSLKDDGYKLIAISGSQQELVEKFCEPHGFDVMYGARYPREDGKFTGDVVKPIGRKHEVLQSIVDELGLTYQGSYGVGDTSSDISMLELVDNPIAFNPSDGLLDVARDKRWQIVIERKNIAYVMQQCGGQDEPALTETIVYGQQNNPA